MNEAHGLAALLVAHDAWLRSLLAGQARGLLRFEPLDDLVQGTHARALAEAGRFAYRGDAEFRAWLATLARRHIGDRHDHYRACKRRATRVLRITLADGHRTAAGATRGVSPLSGKAGPATVAERRELVVLAIQALGALMPRDRDLVRWTSEGISIEEQAQRLGISYEAAQRAVLRAQERLRATFELARRARLPR